MIGLNVGQIYGIKHEKPAVPDYKAMPFFPRTKVLTAKRLTFAATDLEALAKHAGTMRDTLQAQAAKLFYIYAAIGL
ncbi:hypothetical protein [uncultured Bacteroides sp.]|uniref:hypothetical protein n=1 Tax=uncultured Bacteroides sp. TaxID=162156 RepID=UPI0025D90FCF|nr:hypothetical protein [uncultured Bacteroides sp.]